MLGAHVLCRILRRTCPVSRTTCLVGRTCPSTSKHAAASMARMRQISLFLRAATAERGFLDITRIARRDGVVIERLAFGEGGKLRRRRPGVRDSTPMRMIAPVGDM